jgi:4-diphosphocytidyl-2-C-methyl-D-erythritol kinase
MDDTHTVCARGGRRRVSELATRRVVRLAPAKLNLGLEILGRRADGFHDLATIFVAIDLYDHFVLTVDNGLALRCDDPRLVNDENLTLRALRALRADAGYDGGASLQLAKHIPTAAGLGGASSDAAAALLAACDLWNLQLAGHRLHALAAQLGSDVPFFLHGGCALGRGRGDILAHLPLPKETWFVLVVPAVSIPRKTARLFELLVPEDFSDGARTEAQAVRLRNDLPLDPDLLANAFARPLYDLRPEFATLPALMKAAGAPSVAVSGAGPAHFAAVFDPEHAEHIAMRMRERLGPEAFVTTAKPVPAHSLASGPL